MPYLFKFGMHTTINMYIFTTSPYLSCIHLVIVLNYQHNFNLLANFKNLY